MKWMIWTVGGLLAAAWSVALALVALLLGLVGDLLQRAGPAGATVPALPTEVPAGLASWLPTWLPAWMQASLTAWIDPAAWAALVQGVQQALSVGQSVLPALGSATGWIETLVWIVWGLGMLGLLVVAAVSHGLLARRAAVPAPAA